MHACPYSSQERSQEGPNEHEHLKKPLVPRCNAVSSPGTRPKLLLQHQLSKWACTALLSSLSSLGEEDTFRVQGKEMLLHLLFGRDLKHIKHERQGSFCCEVSDPPAGQAFDEVAGSLCVRMVSERQFQFGTLLVCVCFCPRPCGPGQRIMDTKIS